MTRDEIAEINPEALFLDEGFDKALIGLAERINLSVACYATDVVISLLEAQGMSYDEAEEYFEYNILGAWVGENTPVFITI